MAVVSSRYYSVHRIAHYSGLRESDELTVSFVDDYEPNSCSVQEITYAEVSCHRTGFGNKYMYDPVLYGMPKSPKVMLERI